MRDDSSLIGEIAGIISSAAGKIIIAALVVLLVFECGKISFEFGHSIFYQEPVEAKPGTDKVLSFDKEDDMEDVAAELKAEGLIRNELAFVIQSALYKVSLYPGEYVLNTSMTTKEMLLEIDKTAAENKELMVQETVRETVPDGEMEIIGGAADHVDEEQLEAARRDRSGS